MSQNPYQWQQQQQQYAYPPPPPARKSTKKWWLLGCGTGIVLMVLCCGGLGVLGYVSTLPPRGISLHSNMPAIVNEGESFSFTITVVNDNPSPKRLISIDFSDSYLTGVTIQTTTPPCAQSLHIPIVNIQSYEFAQSVPAKSSMDVVFDAVAIAPGNYTGTLDVYVGSELKSVSHTIRTVVKPESTSDNVNDSSIAPSP